MVFGKEESQSKCQIIPESVLTITTSLKYSSTPQTGIPIGKLQIKMRKTKQYTAVASCFEKLSAIDFKC
jgi:hypothetical protein